MTQTTQPVRITDHESLAHITIVMDPQPFPRRFLGEYQVDDEDHLQSRDIDRNLVAAPYQIFPKHEVYVTRLNYN